MYNYNYILQTCTFIFFISPYIIQLNIHPQRHLRIFFLFKYTLLHSNSSSHFTPQTSLHAKYTRLALSWRRRNHECQTIIPQTPNYTSLVLSTKPSSSSSTQQTDTHTLVSPTFQHLHHNCIRELHIIRPRAC